MDHAANKEKYSWINRIAIEERASLEEVDRPFLYPISVTRGRWWRQRNRKTWLLLSSAEMNTGEVWSSDDGDHRHARKHVICAVAATGKLSRWTEWPHHGVGVSMTTLLSVFFFKRYTMNCFQLYVYWINFEERTRIFGLVLFFLNRDSTGKIVKLLIAENLEIEIAQSLCKLLPAETVNTCFVFLAGVMMSGSLCKIVSRETQIIFSIEDGWLLCSMQRGPRGWFKSRSLFMLFFYNAKIEIRFDQRPVALKVLCWSGKL